MAIKPRHAHILDIVREDITVLVQDLATRIGVSESTIRRDLAELEAQGFVRRIHGGAILVDSSHAEPTFALGEISAHKEKNLVARAAAAWVGDGQVVFIDADTTTRFIVPHLHDRRHLTVVTCDLNIACGLRHSKHISTILVGGELHVGTQSFAGPLALKAFQAYGIRCDRALIGTDGVSAQHGVTNRILDRIPLKRQAMAISNKVAVIADGSKIGEVALGHVAPIETFHRLITDRSAPEEELKEIAARGVEIELAG